MALIKNEILDMQQKVTAFFQKANADSYQVTDDDKNWLKDIYEKINNLSQRSNELSDNELLILIALTESLMSFTSGYTL